MVANLGVCQWARIAYVVFFLRLGLLGGPAEQSAQHAFPGLVWILRLAR
jgi:hypothetical protein